MGILSRLFGKRPAPAAPQPPEVSKTLPDAAFYGKVIEAVTVSGSLKQELATRIARAFEDPASFYDETGEFTLSQRGLTYPKDVLKTPKFVLIDTLEAFHEMGELDWKEEESEIRYAVNQVLMAKHYGVSVSEQCRYDNLDTFSIIDTLNEQELKRMGYTLELLDINSDCYVFTIVPLARQAEVAALFHKLK